LDPVVLDSLQHLRMPIPTTINEKDALLAAADLLRSMGASQVFVFGSLVRGELHPDSDIDLAVSGLPAKVYFSAVSRASDILGRPVDLLDLDDDTPLVRHLLGSGELIRVG
jgi:predicted nucleotidyltransferase